MVEAVEHWTSNGTFVLRIFSSRNHTFTYTHTHTYGFWAHIYECNRDYRHCCFARAHCILLELAAIADARTLELIYYPMHSCTSTCALLCHRNGTKMHNHNRNAHMLRSEKLLELRNQKAYTHREYTHSRDLDGYKLKYISKRWLEWVLCAWEKKGWVPNIMMRNCVQYEIHVARISNCTVFGTQIHRYDCSVSFREGRFSHAF